MNQFPPTYNPTQIFLTDTMIDKMVYIADGHHRYQVGIRIGLSRLPVIKVDYLSDDSIELDLWPASNIESITKKIISVSYTHLTLPTNREV